VKSTVARYVATIDKNPDSKAFFKRLSKELSLMAEKLALHMAMHPKHRFPASVEFFGDELLQASKTAKMLSDTSETDCG